MNFFRLWEAKTTAELKRDVERLERRIDEHIAEFNQQRAAGASDGELLEDEQEIVEMSGMLLPMLKQCIAEREKKDHDKKHGFSRRRQKRKR